jgi:cytochrome c-type biogenesis protein
MLGFAVAAGSVAAVNPCGFAMLPAYLTLVVVGDVGERRSRASAVARAQGATLAMAVGFLVVFGTFGLVVAPLAASAQRYLPGITVLIGVLLIGLGAWMLTGREVTVLLPKPRQGAPTARLGSMFGYGLGLCIHFAVLHHRPLPRGHQRNLP